MLQGQATCKTCSEPYIQTNVGSPRTEAIAEVIHVRHTWIQTLEADLQPLSQGLNLACRLPENRGWWGQFVDMPALQRARDDDAKLQMR